MRRPTSCSLAYVVSAASFTVRLRWISSSSALSCACCRSIAARLVVRDSRATLSRSLSFSISFSAAATRTLMLWERSSVAAREGAVSTRTRKRRAVSSRRSTKCFTGPDTDPAERRTLISGGSTARMTNFADSRAAMSSRTLPGLLTMRPSAVSCARRAR